MPSLLTRVASQSVAAYLRYVPVARGKTRVFRLAATRGLIAAGPDGLWLRTSGLTDAEHGFVMGATKEPATVAWLRRTLTADMVCVDVGANIGYFAVLMARHAAFVHAFEPTPTLIPRIGENASLNGLTNIRVHHAAVGDRIGTADLHLSSDDPEANSLHGASGPTVTVPLTTLDASGLTRIDLLKLDCEGSELAVLRGAGQLIARDHPVILLECNTEALAESGHTVHDLTSWLRAAGYTIGVVEQLRADVWNLVARQAPLDLPVFPH